VTTGPRVFRRSLAARLTSLAALLLFGSALALRVAAGEYGAAFVVVAGLALAAAVGSVSAWGDRFRFDDEAVTWENAVLRACAGGRGAWGRRRLAWRDVARVQVHGLPRPGSRPGPSPAAVAGAADAGAGAADSPRALFLVPYRGRRMALDALEDFAEVRRRVERALAAAPPAGVSTPPGDRPR
jgi:hypothetical protein